MKIISLTLFATLSSLTCFAQTKKSEDTTNNKRTLPIFVFKVANQPDIICKAKADEFLLDFVNQNSIKKMVIWKDSAAIKLYGAEGKNGVVEITLVDNTKLISTDQLLKKYNIRKKYQKLPICKDSATLSNPKQIYYDEAAIKSVTVEENSDTHKKYINIVTINSRPKSSGGYYIRGNAE